MSIILNREVNEMTNKQVESLIEKIEKCKTTKSAKTILIKKGIEVEEGGYKSYDFYINGKHYRVVKHKYDDTCHVIKYKRMKFVDCEPRIVPTCYGYCTILTKDLVEVDD